MKIVIDTSILIAVLTNERHKKTIVEQTKNVNLVAPSSMHWEVGNAFSAMFKRDRITLDQAIHAISTYNQIPIKLIDVDLKIALNLSRRFNIYAYDAYFLVCAQKENAVLMSLDKKLLYVANELGIKIREV